MKVLRFLFPALMYFCVATVLSQAVLLGMMFWKGLINEDAALNVLAAVHGYDVVTVKETLALEQEEESREQLDYEEIAAARLRAGLDRDLREMAIDKSLVSLRRMQDELKEQRRRYDEMKEGFDARLAELQEQAADNAITELQRTLESLPPKQAKDQILEMWDDGPTSDDDNPMQDVVTIIKNMPLDKRKKILGEFKTAEEVATLSDILREIRLGTGDVELIKNTRDQLDDVDADEQ